MPLNFFGFMDSCNLLAQVVNPPQVPLALNAISAIASIGVLVCFIMVLVNIFQHGQTGLGVTLVITFFCCGIGILIGLIYGWTKAGPWRIKNLMIAYTVFFAINLGVTAYTAPMMIQVYQQALQQAQQQQGVPVQIPAK